MNVPVRSLSVVSHDHSMRSFEHRRRHGECQRRRGDGRLGFGGRSPALRVAEKHYRVGVM